jgi:hypothetical protein
MKGLHLEARAVTWDEEPVAYPISQEFDRADRRKFAAQFWICGVRVVREN